MRVPEAAERLLTELKARYELDLSGLLAGVRARLQSRLRLTPLSLDGDLAEQRGRAFGLGQVRTEAFESERLRKVVLSEIRLWPVIEGFALTLLPRPEVEAPCFGGDVMLLPTRLSANADVYGPPARTRAVLTPVVERFARLESGPGPAWARALSSGEGLHAKVSARHVDDAFAAFTGALGAFLDAVEAAPVAAEGAAPEASGQPAFFHAFHDHGPRRGPLRLLFGEAWAERYSRLVFE